MSQAERVTMGVVKTASGSYNLEGYPVKPSGRDIQDPPAATPPALAEVLAKALTGEVETPGQATDSLYR